MSETSAAPQAATFQELKQTFPHADAAFREKCLESSMTLDRARDAYASELQAKLSAAEARAEKAETEKAALQTELDAEKAKPRSTRPGAPAMADSGNGASAEQSGDPVAAWNAAIDAEMAKGKSKPAAVEAVVASQPHVHRAFVEATQPGR